MIDGAELLGAGQAAVLAVLLDGVVQRPGQGIGGIAPGGEKETEALFADGQVGVYIIFNLCQGL